MSVLKTVDKAQMDTNQLYLLKDRRFLPLFITQLCGCFNDNVLKSALIIMVTYKLAGETPYPASLMVLGANAIFILPFLVFAGLAGQIADKFERSTLVKLIKVSEIGIVFLAIYGFNNSSLLILYLSICLMGIHSTFFGPLKYSILPDHLVKDELLGANGFVEAGTFLAILIGTIAGSFYNSASTLCIIIMLASALCGIISSFFVPKSNNANPELKLSSNIFQESIDILKYSYTKKTVFLSILGISWFWFIGAVFLTQIPTLTKEILGADESVATMFLAVFAIGVGFGSFGCNKLFENEITTKYVFITAIGISIFSIDLFFATGISAVSHEPDQLKSAALFLFKNNTFWPRLHNWRIMFDLFCVSAISGLYVVPLFAVMQYCSPPAYRSRVIAANNLLNAVFMVAATLILSVLITIGFSVPVIILLLSMINILVAAYIYKLLPEAKIIPESIFAWLFKFICDKLYKVEVRGLENLQKAGKRAVIVANHISLIDPVLLGVYLPDRFTFAINVQVSKLWWVRPFLTLSKTYAIEPNNAMAAKALIAEVKKNKKIVIFPEGRISSTGSLMKVYEGPGMIADKADAVILPIRIDGAQYTHFSRMKKLPKMSFFPHVTITIMPPVRLDAPESMHSRQRRKHIGQKLYDIMSDMMFESSDYKRTFFQSLIDASAFYRPQHAIIQDINNNSATYRQLLTKSFVLGNIIAKNSHEGEYLGIMLPNAVGSVVTFFAMQAFGRVPAMINFTSGSGSIVSACNTARINTIYTSREFIAKAELQELDAKLRENFNVIYLEDLRQNLTFAVKILGLIGGIFPNMYYHRICGNMDDTKPAVVLFTSGTEGQPKAVVLSHRNIQANRCQVAARLDFGIHDVAFNTLPLFHCFGMTGMILMVLQGIRTFLYPSPLHYRIIPEVMYDIGATIMFATDTFLAGYARYAHPYDFYSVRYVFAGAEKLKSETRRLWLEKFGVRIFEGYGATEGSPVIAVNTPMHDKPGSVGRLMPKISYNIQPVEGITEGGMLCIKGPNVMLGYILPSKPGVIVPPRVEMLGNGWYSTGDIVTVDDQGYVEIKGRAKRFAKIAGEMISLTVVEELASYVDCESIHAAVHLLDDKRGEQILLFTTSSHINRETFLSAIRNAAASELHMPKYFIQAPEVPVLATGKINYRLVVQMAEEYIQRLQQNNDHA
jgi:acyl-[acyl-carrier-protein]-phospholipid O-acyltransferase/long-chain-fatty-acid--[acyl-carrier-protein] ligase